MRRFFTMIMAIAAACVSPSFAFSQQSARAVASASSASSASPASASLAITPASVPVLHPIDGIDGVDTTRPAVRASLPSTGRIHTDAGAMSQSTVPAAPAKHTFVLSLVGLAFIGALQTVTQDRDTHFAYDTVRAQHNRLAAWTYYRERNGMISTTVATFPVCAIGTTTTKVKTTNATVLLNAGAVNAFAATDDAFTLTGGVLAALSFRKYLLLVDAADARTVQASSDATTAAGCTFSALPADGLAVVGSILVATDATHTFTPATTALSATGITTTYFDGINDDAVMLFAQVTP